MSRHRGTTRRRGTPCYVCLTRALADGAPPWGVAFAVDGHRGVEHALVVEDDDGVHGVHVASPDEGGVAFDHDAVLTDMIPVCRR